MLTFEATTKCWGKSQYKGTGITMWEDHTGPGIVNRQKRKDMSSTFLEEYCLKSDIKLVLLTYYGERTEIKEKLCCSITEYNNSIIIKRIKNKIS